MGTPTIRRFESCGYVAPGFEDIRTEFENNFIERGEVGASFAVYQNGKKIIDLWGGFKNEEQGLSWERNTIALVCSTTKGIAAAVLAYAHSNGWLDYGTKVSEYWPEFSQNGKGNITIKQLLSHQVGLICLDGGIDVNGMSDLDELAIRLARQKPAWNPGDYWGYHMLTAGLYMNEIIRRTDPKKRSLGQVLQQDIISPSGGNFYIGLPSDINLIHDIAQIYPQNRKSMFQDLRQLPRQALKHLPVMFLPWSEINRITRNMKIRSFKDMMKPDFLRIECASTNGVGNARTIAHIYSLLACPGKESIINGETYKLLKEPASTPRISSIDRVLKVETAYSLGFIKPCGQFRFGSDDKAFGFPGIGGSFGFADPARKIGYAYVPNHFRHFMYNDPREQVLRDTLYNTILS